MRVIWSSLCATLMISAAVWAGESATSQPTSKATSKPTTTTSAPTVDAKVAEIINKMAAYSKTIKNMSVDVEAMTKVTGPMGEQSATVEIVAVVERPNRIAVKGRYQLGDFIVVSDGKTLSVYVQAVGKYTEMPAPKTFEDLTSMQQALLSENFGMVALLSLFGDKVADNMLSGVTVGKYVGLEKVGDVPAHHLHCEQEQMNWDVWISDGAEPRMLRLVPDISRMLAAQGGAEGVKIEMNNLYRNYKINQPLPANAFKFVAPKGADKAESLVDNAPSGEGEGDEPAMQLKGKPAPQFVATTLGGEGVMLKDHIGKHVVVLDFWATWCGPCRRSLPTLVKIASAYADKGVVFYAVNQGEEPKDILNFLAKAGLDRDYVVLDKTGSIGKTYHADAIPQTVIIGADGVVREVHIGMSPDMEKVLTEQLDAAVAARDAKAKK